MTFLRLFLLSYLLFFSGASFLEADDSSSDLVVFAPHPDDETLACGQTIIQAVKEHKKIKVVFLTNGDGSEASAAAFFKKPGSEIVAQDYIVLGIERQEEALRAAVKLGLSKQDLIFLGYPDEGLVFLWGQEDRDRYKSEHTERSAAVYKKTWGRAKSGYTRKNVIQDIKDIFKKYQPKIIYAPSPLDKHKDHTACANFINKALDELKNEQKDKFINPAVFYYIIHTTYNSIIPSANSCTQCQSNSCSSSKCKNNFSSLRPAKAEALKEYRTQLVLEGMERAIEYFLLKNESFYQVPNSKDEYLASVGKEWSRVAGRMKRYGYNLNLGVIADVAGDIDNSGIDLVKKEKIFSDNPESVSRLLEEIVQAHNSQGLTPVVKHFPGLGAALKNTHNWLPKVDSSLAALNEKDFIPYKDLIRENSAFMVMISHAIYPAIDDKPASLSYKIQTQILRKKLGFKGLIISDEFLNMQAIEEYVRQQGIPEPFIGEIVAMSFAAGTDMAIIYPAPEKSEEIILAVIGSAKKAIKEDRLTEQEIDDSVARILREKERIFGKPLINLLKAMSLEDKICQKIIIDTYGDAKIAMKYNLGGIHARDYKVIPKVQAEAKTPFFIAGQHEGGRVNEAMLDLYTQSGYLTGREFERTFKPKNEKSRLNIPDKEEQKTSVLAVASYFDFSQLSSEEQAGIIKILAGSVDAHIKFYSDIKQNKFLSPPSPDYVSPLTMCRENYASSVTLKSFADLPVRWLNNFPDRNTAICAYLLFKETFRKWEIEEHKLEKTRDKPQAECLLDQMISKLTRLKGMFQEMKPVFSSRELRVLCLAAHPDDEDGEGLVYFKKRFNAKTFILMATRGEAGDNEISPAQYDELGFLRTEEMEKSAEVLGVDRVYYLGKKDFGYCFDPQEAFKNWDKNDTLSRLVYFIRLIRPDVIITKHDSLLGHCDHRALNILGQEAFILAGDPKALPVMIKEGLPAWQAKRFYQRQVNIKEASPLEELVVDPKGLIPATNKTYRQQAVEAIAEHKSQGDMSYTFSCPKKIVYELVKEADGSKNEADAIMPADNSKAVYSGFPGIKKANKLRIGLIEQDDNILFISLKTLGCDFTLLDEKSILQNDLSGLDTILVGKGANKLFSEENIRKQLEDFVVKGGHLVVLFQPKKPGAVNILFGQTEVIFDAIVGRDSQVVLLAPEHALFNWPNKISALDFSGWKQERGLFFSEKPDHKFKELTSCLDSKFKTVKSGYLISDYGRGSFIFTTYSWSRQLREFHPGAFKNLANMISYPLRETRPKNNEDWKRN